MDKLLGHLSHSGYRITKQRKAILDVMDKTSKFLSAEEIYNKSKEEQPCINLATVYRNLDVLNNINAVEMIDLGDNCYKYRLKGKEHNHCFICLECGETIEFPLCPLSDVSDILEKNDLTITGHRFEIYGYCSECSNKGGK